MPSRNYGLPSKPATQTRYYPFNGGLDIVTPALSVDPGFALTMVNYEPWYNGGYRRVDGYERFDGHAKPSNAVVYGAVMSALTGLTTGTGAAAAGTGVISGATAQFVEGVVVGGTSWVALTNVSGTFGTGEKIRQSGGTSTGTLMTVPSQNYGPLGTSTTGFNYTSDFLANAQAFYRAQINAVPGTGNVQGVWQLGTSVYAWRGTSTGALMYKATGTGWAAAGTYCTTVYYTGLGQNNAIGTGTVSAQGVVGITAMSTGTYTVGMTLSDTTGYIPQGATVIQLLSGTGGVGSMQLSENPAMAVPSETIYGLNPSYNLPAVGATVTGASSGATGTLYQAVPHDTSVGYLALTGVSGTFSNGENLQVSSVTFAQANGTSTKFAFPATGFYRFLNSNFYAATSQYYIYGVNGQGPAFQIDQNGVIMPILMPALAQPNQPATNNPFLACAYSNFLFLAFPGGVLQQSVQGVPVQFDGFLGAAEFGVGAEITGLQSMVGPNLIIPTARNTQGISGNSDATFQQATIAEKAGSILYANVLLDTVYALNNLGITSLSRTQSYGNFVGSTISQLVQPMVTALRPFFADATIVRGSNEARFYFSDGSVLIIYVPGLGQQNKAWSAIESGVTAQFGYANYPAPIYCIYNSEDQNNSEVGYFGSSNGDGYVYQDRSGTSWDGAQITSYVRLAFNNVGTPATRKYFRRADLEINSPAQVYLKFAADLSYSNQESSSAVANLTATNIPVSNVFGGGGYWDNIEWNQFYWDGQTISTARAQLGGTGENISFLIFHQAIVDTPFILQGLVLHFDPRRLQR